jgi:hypothetical protein
MSKIFSSFVLVLFLISTVFPISSFAFQNCECTFPYCRCYLANIEFGVDISRGKICDTPGAGMECLLFFGEVINLNLPFLKLETLEESQRKAEVLLKKNLTLSERVDYSVSSLFSKTGSATESDKLMQILKEKTLAASKSQSEKASVDLTLYFVNELAKDISFQKKPNAAAVLLTVRALASLAKEGELANFLSFYFYLRSKHPEWLVSSDFEDSKKAPLPVLTIYLHPDKVNEWVSTYAFMFKDLLERAKKIIQAGNKADEINATRELLSGLFSLGSSGMFWGLDEQPQDLIIRVTNYLPNYEKILNNSDQVKQEVKEIRDLLHKKGEDKKVKRMKREKF